MWELDCEESWVLRNWCFWTVVLEKTLESPLGCKEIQPVHPKGDQSWVFIGRTDAEAETPILWPPHAKNWLIEKDPDAGRDWGQEEKGTTEDEKAGWHHQFNGHGLVWIPAVGDGHGGLVFCDSWGPKESDTTEGLNWTELMGQEEPLQEETATHPSIFPWRIPWTEETAGYSSWGYKESDTTELTQTHVFKLGFASVSEMAVSLCLARLLLLSKQNVYLNTS